MGLKPLPILPFYTPFFPGPLICVQVLPKGFVWIGKFLRSCRQKDKRQGFFIVKQGALNNK